MRRRRKCVKCGSETPPIYAHIVDWHTLNYVRLCRYCYREEVGEPLILREIFTQHTPIVEGGSQHGRYRCLFRIERRQNPNIVTLQKLMEYVDNLNRRYPNEKFYLKKINYKTEKLYILAKRKNKTEIGRIPIYFNLEKQAFYIEKETLQRNPKLANYIIMTTLGALGVSQSKYADGLRKTV